MELCQGRGSWGLGTGAAPEGSGHRTGCPGQRPQWGTVCTAPVPEFMVHLHSAPRRRVRILSGPAWSQKLDLMILVSPFQLSIFSYPMIL